MKEASGELNMTAITIVAIAAIAGFFYAFVWPSLKMSITKNQQCASAICEDCIGTTKTCEYFGADGVLVAGLKCPCKESENFK